jgi:hypothetical protein
MVQEIISLYRDSYNFIEFYDRLLFNIKTWPEYHIGNTDFLKGFQPSLPILPFESRIKVIPGDIRVDLPIWFGAGNSSKRFMVIGMEPRNTDEEGYLNIERVDRLVYGTPFALERPGGKYHSALDGLIESSDCFVYLTDVVKEYEVGDSKADSDKIARLTFREKALSTRSFLLKELSIIKPTHIVALGDESHKLLSEILGQGYAVRKIRHPSQGGSRKAREQLATMLQASY